MKLRSQIAVAASRAQAKADFESREALRQMAVAAWPMTVAQGSGYSMAPTSGWAYGTVLRPRSPAPGVPVNDDRMLFLGFANQRPGFYGVVLRSEDAGREHEPPAIYSVRNWEPADEA